MRMQHQFTVPAPINLAWPMLLDPERVAPCMPGATLTKAEGNEFSGSVKVRLGPISLLYKGSGTFSEIDSEKHSVVIDASGKDARGNGTAAAKVTAQLTDQGESTSVTVDTDLKVTGKPAQLGRGLISEVGGKIIDQFAECLAGRLSALRAGEVAEESEPPTAQASEPSAAESAASTASGTGASEGDRESSTVAGRSNGGRPAPASGTTSGGGKPVGRPPAWRVTSPSEETVEAASSASTARERDSSKADAVVTGKAMPSDEAIDLLGTAGTPVLKRVAPIAGAFAVLVVLLRLRRRRRRR